MRLTGVGKSGGRVCRDALLAGIVGDLEALIELAIERVILRLESISSGVLPTPAGIIRISAIEALLVEIPGLFCAGEEAAATLSDRRSARGALIGAGQDVIG